MRNTTPNQGRSGSELSFLVNPASFDLQSDNSVISVSDHCVSSAENMSRNGSSIAQRESSATGGDLVLLRHRRYEAHRRP